MLECVVVEVCYFLGDVEISMQNDKLHLRRFWAVWGGIIAGIVKYDAIPHWDIEAFSPSLYRRFMIEKTKVLCRQWDEDYRTVKQAGRVTYCDVPIERYEPPYIYIYIYLMRSAKQERLHKFVFAMAKAAKQSASILSTEQNAILSNYIPVKKEKTTYLPLLVADPKTVVDRVACISQVHSIHNTYGVAIPRAEKSNPSLPKDRTISANHLSKSMHTTHVKLKKRTKITTRKILNVQCCHCQSETRLLICIIDRQPKQV